MSTIVLGTEKFRDIVEWEKICKKYGVDYILKTKHSDIGVEDTWYQLTVDLNSGTKYLNQTTNHKKECFINDIRECWKPERLRHYRYEEWKNFWIEYSWNDDRRRGTEVMVWDLS